MKTRATVLTTLIGTATGAASVFAAMNKKVKKLQEIDRKNDKILKLYNQWMSLKQEGKSMVDYFKENGYQKIAVYGMHYMGENLCGELEGSDIAVKYAIDKNADRISSDIVMYKPDDELIHAEEVDAVVVTAFHFYDEIEEQLSQYLDCPIISIEDIILYDL